MNWKELRILLRSTDEPSESYLNEMVISEPQNE